jgi:hypothetical protein
MDWNSVLTTIAIVAFIVLMMRGCGGMMAGGGCGMGKPRRRDKSTQEQEGTPS